MGALLSLCVLSQVRMNRIMQKAKGILLVAGTLLLVGGAYLALRSAATGGADREIDAFFVDFRAADKPRFERHLRHVTQSQSDVSEIIQRHKNAIHNFAYDTLTPELNMMLNETRVEVSWHLAIIFRKRDGHWHPADFDEYVAGKKS